MHRCIRNCDENAEILTDARRMEQMKGGCADTVWRRVAMKGYWSDVFKTIK